MTRHAQNIPLAYPEITEEDIRAVTAVLRSRHLSLGPKLSEFEKKFAAFVGTRYAVAVNSGTSALHLAIRALGIGDGDEVITTPFSFIASANCVLFEKAAPIFVDVLPETGCMDPQKVEAAITPNTKAILAIDIFGYLADWDALRAIAKKHNLALIEDSCEALGSQRGGKQAGSFGDIGVFGFYPNKQITTGEGGMFVTDNEEFAEFARSAANQGRVPKIEEMLHDQLGYNYRISDINCALGITQLKRLPKMIEQKKKILSWYLEALAPLADHIELPKTQENVDISFFVFTIRLREHYTEEHRKKITTYLREGGVECRNYLPAIHLQPLYRKQFGFHEFQFPVTESLAGRTIAIPFFTTLSQQQVNYVAKTLSEAFDRLSSEIHT